MKATEFVKKYGWDLAIRDIAALKGGFIKREDFLEHYGFDVLDDLQNLVNAYELVGKYRNTYGESARWFFIAEYCKEHRLAPHQADVYDFVAAKYDSYVYALESCT